MWHDTKCQAGLVVLLVLLAIVVVACDHQINTTSVISERGNTIEEITLSLEERESYGTDNATLPVEQDVSEPVDIVAGLNYSTGDYESSDGNSVTLTQPPQIDIANLEKEIHDLVNTERDRLGLSPLAWDQQLNEVARKHSEDMARRGYFSHVTPEGYTLLERYQQAGYQVATGVAENIFQCTLAKCDWYRNGAPWYTEYYSQSEIAILVVEGWMNSPGHRQNILAGYWVVEGIGVGISPDGKVYITQDFN